MASKASNKPDKVFDVAKPGKTAAGASGRPLIVGHRTLMQDPMVKDADDIDAPSTAPVLDEDDKPSGGASKTTLSSKIMEPSPTKVEPVEEKEPDVEVEVKTDDQPPAEEPEPEPAVEDTTPTKDEAKPPEDKAEEDTTSDSATVNTVAGQVAKKQQDQKEQEAEIAKTAEIEKLIDDKKYYVPIGEKKRKRSMRHIFLGMVLVLVLGFLLVNVLMEVGIIHINNIQPPLKIINR